MSAGTVTVWRVEGPDGRGPYGRAAGHVPSPLDPPPVAPRDEWSTVATLAGVPGYWGAPLDRPVPWEDGLAGAVAMRLRFGCPSRAAAERWFTREALERMAAWGFHLRRFEVPREHVHFGESGLQVAFERAAAVEVGKSVQPAVERSES